MLCAMPCQYINWSNALGEPNTSGQTSITVVVVVLLLVLVLVLVLSLSSVCFVFWFLLVACSDVHYFVLSLFVLFVDFRGVIVCCWLLFVVAVVEVFAAFCY